MESEGEKRALNCARAFSASTGFGATVLRGDGAMLAGYGACLGNCPLCAIAGIDKRGCSRSHILGMGEAERFGGKYVYFCALGLTCFTTPIVSESSGGLLMITGGPCLMVDREDYTACELQSLNLDEAAREEFSSALLSVPYAPPPRVQELSTLLFMAAGFLGNTFRASRMLDKQFSGEMQGQISAYIHALKRLDEALYPMETERAMLAAMSRRDRGTAQKLLNELLGHILLMAGADFSSMVSRVNELMVLMSRTAIENGADVSETLRQSHESLQALKSMEDADTLCFYLSRVMNRMMENVFRFPQSNHASQIRKAVEHIENHASEKLSLQDVADLVYLTPLYFGRVFKRETGSSFSNYVNRVRVEKSKVLLLNDALRLTDIAQLTGFEDQSYFTKVFKRVEGVTPDKYRKRVSKTMI